jgi:hypothetical protein
MLKIFKTLLLGLIFITSVGFTVEPFSTPKIDRSKARLTYKGETYTSLKTQEHAMPFVTNDFSIVILEHYVSFVNDRLSKGVMTVSLYNGPTFAYGMYDFNSDKGYGLIDTDCDGYVDKKELYDVLILIPDCFIEHKTHEIN